MWIYPSHASDQASRVRNRRMRIAGTDPELGARRGFAEPVIVPPTGSTLGIQPTEDVWIGNTKATLKPSKIYLHPPVRDAIADFTKPRSALYLEGAKP